MQQKRGNHTTRGTFIHQRTQQTGPTWNSDGPAGAATNRDQMPVGGFQGNAGRGRNNAGLNIGPRGNRGNFQNGACVQQNNQNRTNSNYNNPINQTTTQRGQGRPTQNIRQPPLEHGNTQQYNVLHDDGQGTNYGGGGNMFSTYQPGPYGDMDHFDPWNQGGNNTMAMPPYNNTQATYSNNFGGLQYPNQSFSAQSCNTGYHPQTIRVGNRGGINQASVGMGYQGNGRGGLNQAPFRAGNQNSGRGRLNQTHFEAGNQNISRGGINQAPLGLGYEGNGRVGINQTPVGGGYQDHVNMNQVNSWRNENSYLSMLKEWTNPGSYNTDTFNGATTMDTNISRVNERKEEPKKARNVPAKTAIGELQKSMHVLTGDIAQLKHWNMFKDSIQMMYQVFGMGLILTRQLQSAVSRVDTNSREFLVKDEKNNNMKCVFYEIDRQMPKLTRGQWYRLVGTYDSGKERMNCMSVRQMLPGETNLVHVLSNKSSEVMKKLTLSAREM